MKRLFLFCFLLTACSSSKPNLLDEALGLEKSRNYSKSLEKYNQFISKNKNNSLAFTGRGHCKYHLNDFKGCIQDNGIAIKLNPKNARAYDLKGLCEYKTKDYKSAIIDLTKTLELERNNPPAQKDLADCKKLIKN